MSSVVAERDTLQEGLRIELDKVPPSLRSLAAASGTASAKRTRLDLARRAARQEAERLAARVHEGRELDGGVHKGRPCRVGGGARWGRHQMIERMPLARFPADAIN